ncbi:MAG: NAD(P)-dependent oxidoreductase [Pseudomonadota bacterium]
MASNKLADGIHSCRLTPEEYETNFSDVHPPLDPHEALVAADRCYFCHDAPCVTACPTEIDIPIFIRQIATGNTLGSAKTIFDQNILGGMCARVCPTETLCEQACVRETAEGKPVNIGLLQRFATDEAMAENKQFYERAEQTGKKIAVVGAGPAGLACAHRLAMHGHQVTVYDALDKSGGLNEYGIAAYKAVDGFAQTEVDYVTEIGGIDIVNGMKLGAELSLDQLGSNNDAVFLSIGLAGVNALGMDDDIINGIDDAVDFIAALRQSESIGNLSVGRRVMVIGGGMTAIDAAVQSKLLGAEEVTICYRRGKEHMNASEYEQELATSKGVIIRHWLQPSKVDAQSGNVSAIEFEYTELYDGKLVGTGDKTSFKVDQVLVAIGQSFTASDLNGSSAAIDLHRGRIKVDEEFRTSVPGVWAGGDCISFGEDLTVSAVAHGRDAAESIHKVLSA